MFLYFWGRFLLVRENRQVLKYFCTYILLVALTVQSFYRTIMAMDYQLHLPEYLAKCINIDRPQLQCNGSCVLMEKIREKEEEETKRNLVVYEYSALYVHKERPVFTLNQPNEEIRRNHFSPNLIDYRFTYHSAIFRPPIA